jgi:AcrR family transcriptional regulator
MSKRQLIINTAIQLFVENGFHGTATSKIAVNSSIATGSLFNYFKTKEELILAIYTFILEDLDSFIIGRLESHSISKQSFQSIFMAYVNWSIEHPLEHQYLQQFSHSPYSKLATVPILNQQKDPLFILIENGISLVLIKQLPASFIYSLFLAQINGLNSYIISNPLSNDKQLELIEDTFEMFWKMIED